MSRLLEKGSLIDYTKLGKCKPDTVCTGFGASSAGVPLRSHVYSLPLQQVAMTFGLHPQAYTATLFAPELLGACDDVIRASASQQRDFIDHCNSKFGLPSIEWLPEVATLSNVQGEYLAHCTQVLRECGEQKIHKFCKTRNDHESYRYAAAHAMYMWLPLPSIEQDPKLCLVTRNTLPKNLLMVGGPAEDMFQDVQKTLWQYECPRAKYGVGTRWNYHMASHDIGRRPPYQRFVYQNVPGEPVVGDTLPQKFEDGLGLFHPEVRSDWINLLIALSEKTPFQITNEYGQQARTAKLVVQGKVPGDMMTDLRQSYDVFRGACESFPKSGSVFTSLPV